MTTSSLHHVLETLRAHESNLRGLGVDHAAVFGSVARGQTSSGSDIDVLIELDATRPIGLFQYARVKLYIDEVLGGKTEVANHTTLKPLLRSHILRDAVRAF